MVAAATKQRSGGGGGHETQIRLVSSSSLICSVEFEDCRFSLSHFLARIEELVAESGRRCEGILEGGSDEGVICSVLGDFWV